MPLPPDTPPPIGPRGLAIRVAVQGRDAYQGGAPVTACPYGPTRPYSKRAWVAGYVDAALAAGVRLPADVADEADPDAPWPGDDTPE